MNNKIRGIIKSEVAPDKHCLWIKNDKIYIFGDKGWKPISGDSEEVKQALEDLQRKVDKNTSDISNINAVNNILPFDGKTEVASSSINKDDVCEDESAEVLYSTVDKVFIFKSNGTYYLKHKTKSSLYNLPDNSAPISEKVYINNGKLYGYNANDGLKVIANNVSIAPLWGNLGMPPGKVAATSLSGNAVLNVEKYPQFTRNSGCISFDAKITSFNAIRCGITTNDRHGDIYIDIDNNNITIKRYNGGAKKEEVIKKFKHSLTISNFVRGFFSYTDCLYQGIICSMSGSYVFRWQDEDIRNQYGMPYLKVISTSDKTTSLTDVNLSVSNDKFRCPVWVLGDSYTEIMKERWTYHMLYEYNVKDFYLCGLAGGHSDTMLQQLKQALKFGCPKYLIWALGMNDGDSDTEVNADWFAAYNEVTQICNDNNITLISVTIPLVESVNNSFKNAYIKEHAARIWDSAKAVGADLTSTWYEGYLESDKTRNIHPTELGAQAQAASLLIDVPELLLYSQSRNHFDSLNVAKKDNTELKSLTLIGEETKVYINVTDTSKATKVLGTGCSLSSIEHMYIDGREIEPVAAYQFTDTGEHEVSFIFKTADLPPKFGNEALFTKVIVGNQIKEIGIYAFAYNTHLKEVWLGENVKIINSNMLNNDTSLKIIRCFGKSEALLSGDVFNKAPSNCVLFHFADIDFSEWVTTLEAKGWQEHIIR